MMPELTSAAEPALAHDTVDQRANPRNNQQASLRIEAISVGADPPHEVNVIVEVPVGGEPIKYEMDKEAGTLVVDRFLYTSMRYPGNYGFIPHTLSGDGDPLDVLIANQRGIVPGALIAVRPIGVFRMQDEAGVDEKMIAVPVSRLTRRYDQVADYTQLPEITRQANPALLRALQGPRGQQVGEAPSDGATSPRRRRSSWRASTALGPTCSSGPDGGFSRAARPGILVGELPTWRNWRGETDFWGWPRGPGCWRLGWRPARANPSTRSAARAARVAVMPAWIDPARRWSLRSAPPARGARPAGADFASKGSAVRRPVLVAARPALHRAPSERARRAPRSAAGSRLPRRPRPAADGPATRAPTGTTCLSGVCANGVVTGGARRDGQGTAGPAPPIVCAPYGCDSATNLCLTACQSDGQCAAGLHCQSGSCAGDPGLGACSRNEQCFSGNCVDGVCCNTACKGPCVSCAITGRVGTCSPVSVGSLDPHAVCVDQGASSCGHDGTCDGQGGCILYAAGVTCAATSSCSGTLWSGTGACDGAGTCQRQTRPCLPYACDPQTNACHSACATADDCAPGKPCVNGTCGIREPAVCSVDAECASGFCAQGACCTTKCDSPCSSCALPGTIGTCAPVPNPPDAGACAS